MLAINAIDGQIMRGGSSRPSHATRSDAAHPYEVASGHDHPRLRLIADDENDEGQKGYFVLIDIEILG